VDQVPDDQQDQTGGRLSEGVERGQKHSDAWADVPKVRLHTFG
jgi:hypothetical protein